MTMNEERRACLEDNVVEFSGVDRECSTQNETVCVPVGIVTDTDDPIPQSRCKSTRHGPEYCLNCGSGLVIDMVVRYVPRHTAIKMDDCSDVGMMVQRGHAREKIIWDPPVVRTWVI